ncbi:MAG: preprotein translocase subunit YajC [Dehalococcoidia bacterium]|nr:preprotein translocase subunit YajC [Dehalococcoidia bacterium]
MNEQIAGLLPLLFFFALMFGAMYFFTIRPQRKRQKEQEELLLSLKKGTKIVTSGGIYGMVESVEDTTVIIKTESGALLRIAKLSIVGRQA